MARRGNSGRIPDSLMDDYQKYERLNITLPPDLMQRLEAYCKDEERGRSWCIQKALDKWLKSKGY